MTHESGYAIKQKPRNLSFFSVFFFIYFIVQNHVLILKMV